MEQLRHILWKMVSLIFCMVTSDSYINVISSFHRLYESVDEVVELHAPF